MPDAPGAPSDHPGGGDGRDGVTGTPAVAAALLILILGGALRLYDNTETVISQDDAFSWRITRYPVGELLRRVGDDANPPLYYLTLKAWVAVWGDSLTAMRGLSALFGCLTLGALVAFARDLHGRRDWSPGLLAAALVCVNPLQVALGRVARAYTLGTFLAVVSSWLLWRGLTDGRRRWWFGYALTAAALAYTHHYGLFTLAAHVCFVAGWIAFGPSRAGPARGTVLRRGAGAAGILGALYLPWLPTLFRQVSSVRHEFWIPPLTADNVIELAGFFLTGWRDLGDVARPVVAAVGGLVVLGLALRRDAPGAYLLVLVLFPWAAAVGASVVGSRPILVDRYLVFAQLFYLVGLGFVLVRVANGTVRFGLIGVVLLNFAHGTVQVVRHPANPSDNLERLTTHLAHRVKPNEPVIVFSPGTANQVLYYATRAGVPVDLRVVGEFTKSGGHQVHAAAITENEWIHPSALSTVSDPVVWVVVGSNSGFSYPDHWSVRSSRFFADNGHVGWALNEFEVCADPSRTKTVVHRKPRAQ